MLSITSEKVTKPFSRAMMMAFPMLPVWLTPHSGGTPQQLQASLHSRQKASETWKRIPRLCVSSRILWMMGALMARFSLL